MPKKICVYHRSKETRLVTCIVCNQLVCVDDTYPFSIEEFDKVASSELKTRNIKKVSRKKRIRVCIPCHADLREAELKDIKNILPHIVGIFFALLVIVTGFPFLEQTFQPVVNPGKNTDWLVVYGWSFAVLITFFLIPTFVITLLGVHLYQKWNKIKKYRLEKQYFLESIKKNR